MEDKKRAVRKEMMELRANMSPVLRARVEAMLAARLMGTNMWKCAENILLFNSTFREVSTKPLIDCALSSGKRLYLPKTECKDMSFFLIRSVDDLTLGNYGIMEPPDDFPLPGDIPRDATLCVVPSLACDKEGYRLGFGGGYYDRFFAANPFKTVTILFDKCVLDKLPRGEHDLKVDAILTENGFVYGKDWEK